MLLGAHMSIAGGVDKALVRGGALGCEAVQIFLKSNMQWRGHAIGEAERERFFAHRAAGGIKAVFAHDCYLINLASPDDRVYEKSQMALLDELMRAELLRLPYIVMHPGAHLGSGVRAGIRRLADALNRLLRAHRGGSVSILLETTSGQGTSVGYRFEQIAEIIEGIKNRARVGVCVDTCHVFAAGYDLRTPASYRETFREIERIIGLKRVKVFHLNDSRKPLGARIDRHEHIGKGYLGLDAFRLLLNDERFRDVPMVLETPKGKGDRYDRRNLATLRRLVRGKLRS
jgi:deoxyribonuclease-4